MRNIFVKILTLVHCYHDGYRSNVFDTRVDSIENTIYISLPQCITGFKTHGKIYNIILHPSFHQNTIIFI